MDYTARPSSPARSDASALQARNFMASATDADSQSEFRRREFLVRSSAGSQTLANVEFAPIPKKIFSPCRMTYRRRRSQLEFLTSLAIAGKRGSRSLNFASLSSVGRRLDAECPHADTLVATSCVDRNRDASPLLVVKDRRLTLVSVQSSTFCPSCRQ